MQATKGGKQLSSPTQPQSPILLLKQKKEHTVSSPAEGDLQGRNNINEPFHLSMVERALEHESS